MQDEDLRGRAYRLACFLGLPSYASKRLVLSTDSLIAGLLGRYTEDLCLPDFFTKDIIRVFSKKKLFTMTVTTTRFDSRKKRWLEDAFPSVSVRALACLVVVMKFYFGLDGVQEYWLAHNADIASTQDTKHFNIIDWYKLSKLRLDHLISSDFIVREQFRSFKGVGTPLPSLESMDEVRQLLEQAGLTPKVQVSKYMEDLRNIVGQGETVNLTKDKKVSLKHLQEKTSWLLKTTKSSKLTRQLNRLLAMPAEVMETYRYRKTKNGPSNVEIIVVSDHIKQVTFASDRITYESASKCRRIERAAVPVPPSGRVGGVSERSVRFDRNYWVRTAPIQPRHHHRGK